MRCQLSAAQPFQRLGHAMAVALARFGFVAGQSNAMALAIDPPENFLQRCALLRQALALIREKKRIIICLRLQLLPVS